MRFVLFPKWQLQKKKKKKKKNSGHLLFEVNTECILSTVMKISVNSRVHNIYWRKVNFLFIIPVHEK